MGKFIVDDNNNGDFSTIAEAIAVASKGDEIIVTGGDDNIHNEANIAIDKELKIKSDSNGAIINGDGAGRIFTIDDGDADNLIKVELEKLTITGGISDDIGGAILNNEKLTIKESTITGNTALLRGGGVYNLDGELKVEKSEFSDNIAIERGGGGIFSTGELKVKETTIENSFANGGGGIVNFGKATIKDSTIRGNTALVGGGLINEEGQLKIEKSAVIENYASIDGGGIVNLLGELEVKESNISDNTADAGGGGIFNEEGQLKVQKSIISGNVAGDGDFDNYIFDNDGGAIFDLYGTSEIKDSTIDGNRADDNGGAIFVYGSTLTVDETTVSNNSAPYAAITVQFSDATITDSKFADNSGFFGGAINAERDDRLILNKNDFKNNTSVIGDSNIFATDTVIFGTEDAEELMGTSGEDFLNGLEGNDTIAGMSGEDVLIGELGNDVFVLAAGEGTDSIADFIDGEDLIGISGGISFGDLDLTGAEISLNGETLAVLPGVDTATLTREDFLFDHNAGNGSTGDNGAEDSGTGNGGNTMFGTDGEDLFNLAGEPETVTIIDFVDGEDLIGLSAGTSFEDLTLVGEQISLNGETLAIVSGINTATLTGDDFTPGELTL